MTCYLFPALLLTFQVLKTSSIQRSNFLFIIFDDLRIELPMYGRKHMITPNFDRLSQYSVIFDKAFTQIAVCNPSRDSLLTGLRPDTVGTYGFQSSFRPYMVFPTHLARSGYNTASVGKIGHWEIDDRDKWNFDSWENNWFQYQNEELRYMNSSTTPDKVWQEDQFRDHIHTTKAVEILHKLVKRTEYFMFAMGFKLPHLQVHVPFKYYEMYKNKTDAWKLTKKELRYPVTSPAVGYRNNGEFSFINEEGSQPAKKHISLGDINMPFTDRIHDELMMGYCGAITFVDKQLGRILDVVDQYQLWNNLTIILTADHGMHNGEKGMWEKWTMFDESTRVPLLIAHPQSPFKGQHYTEPVELIDIYPTILDLLAVPPVKKEKVCRGDNIYQCQPLQGKSLAPIVLGQSFRRRDRSRAAAWNNLPQTFTYYNVSGAIYNVGSTFHSAWAHGRRFRGGSSQANITMNTTVHMPTLQGSFAISQSWRCAPLKLTGAFVLPTEKGEKVTRPASDWRDGDKTKNPPDEICLMGYSMRTSDFRYTAWYGWNRTHCLPLVNTAPIEEELYDHRSERLEDFTHLELTNLVKRPKAGIQKVIASFRLRLLEIVETRMIYRGCFK